MSALWLREMNPGQDAKSEQQIIDKIALLASSVTLCSPHHSPQEAEVSNKLPLERSKSFFRVLIKCSLTHEYFVFPSTVSFFACAPTYFYLPLYWAFACFAEVALTCCPQGSTEL